ncbi:MAG: serine/threonine protein kinase, partial [Rhodobacterales bacterium 17-64-5]
MSDASDKGPNHATTVSSGTLIMGTYEIEKLINSGGMGEVYRGRNIHNDEPVAIKIVLPSLAHDPKIVALFQKESTTLSRLSHEAIVRYHVFTVDPTIGRPCMVMEFVSGTSMSDRIEQGPMPVDDVRVMLRRVASGLDKAHRAGVVHRDLSPDNVILEDGHVEHAKLIDFGIAKSTALGAGTLLQGQFAGKFNWVSPEQLGAFGGTVDGRSDIYSLALVTAAASKGAVLPMGASIVDAVGKRSAVPDLTGVDEALVPLL